MKTRKITPSIDEDVLAAAQRYAAERNSTVKALVCEYLTNIAARHDRVKQARTKARQLSEQSPVRLGKKTWARDDLHARLCVSRS